MIEDLFRGNTLPSLLISLHPSREHTRPVSCLHNVGRYLRKTLRPYTRRASVYIRIEAFSNTALSLRRYALIVRLKFQLMPQASQRPQEERNDRAGAIAAREDLRSLARRTWKRYIYMGTRVWARRVITP